MWVLNVAIVVALVAHLRAAAGAPLEAPGGGVPGLAVTTVVAAVSRSNNRFGAVGGTVVFCLIALLIIWEIVTSSAGTRRGGLRRGLSIALYPLAFGVLLVLIHQLAAVI